MAAIKATATFLEKQLGKTLGGMEEALAARKAGAVRGAKMDMESLKGMDYDSLAETDSARALDDVADAEDEMQGLIDFEPQMQDWDTYDEPFTDLEQQQTQPLVWKGVSAKSSYEPKVDFGDWVTPHDYAPPGAKPSKAEQLELVKEEENAYRNSLVLEQELTNAMRREKSGSVPNRQLLEEWGFLADIDTVREAGHTKWYDSTRNLERLNDPRPGRAVFNKEALAAKTKKSEKQGSPTIGILVGVRSISGAAAKQALPEILGSSIVRDMQSDALKVLASASDPTLEKVGLQPVVLRGVLRGDGTFSVDTAMSGEGLGTILAARKWGAKGATPVFLENIHGAPMSGKVTKLRIGEQTITNMEEPMLTRPRLIKGRMSAMENLTHRNHLVNQPVGPLEHAAKMRAAYSPLTYSEWWTHYIHRTVVEATSDPRVGWRAPLKAKSGLQVNADFTISKVEQDRLEKMFEPIRKALFKAEDGSVLKMLRQDNRRWQQLMDWMKSNDGIMTRRTVYGVDDDTPIVLWRSEKDFVADPKTGMSIAFTTESRESGANLGGDYAQAHIFSGGYEAQEGLPLPMILDKELFEGKEEMLKYIRGTQWFKRREELISIQDELKDFLKEHLDELWVAPSDEELIDGIVDLTDALRRDYIQTGVPDSLRKNMGSSSEWGLNYLKDKHPDWGLEYEGPQEAAAIGRAISAMIHYASRASEVSMTPFVTNIKNPLWLPDTTNFFIDTITNLLKDVDTLKHRKADIIALQEEFGSRSGAQFNWTNPDTGEVITKQFDRAGLTAGIHKLLEEEGYDSIAYYNFYEQAGRPSFIVWNPKYLKTPWAEGFDINSPDYIKGVVGLGLSGAMGDAVYKELNNKEDSAQAL